MATQKVCAPYAIRVHLSNNFGTSLVFGKLWLLVQPDTWVVILLLVSIHGKGNRIIILFFYANH